MGGRPWARRHEPSLGQAGSTHLVSVAEKAALLPGVDVQDDNDCVTGVHHGSPVPGPQRLRTGARCGCHRLLGLRPPQPQHTPPLCQEHTHTCRTSPKPCLQY